VERTTSNIASELSGPTGMTPRLLQLCISGVVFPLVTGWVAVNSNTAFNFDVVFAITAVFEAFVVYM